VGPTSRGRPLPPASPSPPWPATPCRLPGVLSTPALYPLPSTTVAFNARQHPRASSPHPLPPPPH
jgi:hypothetical protein